MSIGSIGWATVAIATAAWAGVAWLSHRRRHDCRGSAPERDVADYHRIYSLPADEFVYVNDDGSARELTADDRAYLSTEFLPFDGARPYVKADYGARTPDGRLGGYLERRRLPPHIAVRPVDATGG